MKGDGLLMKQFWKKLCKVAPFVLVLCAVSCASRSAINRDAIEESIKIHGEQFKSCFEVGSKAATHALSGLVRVSFVIRTTGEARDIKVIESELMDQTIEQCIVDEFKRVRFPKGAEELSIKYPLRFTASAAN